MRFRDTQVTHLHLRRFINNGSTCISELQ